MSPTTPVLSYMQYLTKSITFSILSSLGFQDITLSGISSDLFCSKSSVSVLSSSSSPRPYKFSVPRYSDLEPLLYHTHCFANLIQSLSIRYYLYTNNALVSLWSPVCFHELQTHILATNSPFILSLIGWLALVNGTWWEVAICKF